MRRQNSNALTDIYVIAEALPAWGSAALAVGAYFGLRILAGSDIHGESPRGVVELAMYGLHVLAYYSQYLIPFIIILGGISGWIKRTRSKRQFNRITRAADRSQAIRALPWEVFERMTGEAFRRQGFTVSETAKGADGGVDLVLRRGGQHYLVQCKHWKANKVSVQIVRELYGVIMAQGANGGFVVTSGGFTREARRFAEQISVQLIGGATLSNWFADQAGTAISIDPPSCAAAIPAPVNSPDHCPKCRSPMAIRTVKRGAAAGSEFLGCTRYPACRGTRQAVTGTKR